MSVLFVLFVLTLFRPLCVCRYMEQVPEVNFMSQVQRNKEVKVNLMDPDLQLLQVKESLTHMRRVSGG